MDLKMTDAVIVEDITNHIDVPKLQHDANSTLNFAEISHLLANTNLKQSVLHSNLSTLEAHLTTDKSALDKNTSKQIWSWIFDNVFNTRFLNDSYQSGSIDEEDSDYGTALRILLLLQEYDHSLLGELPPNQISSLIVCSTNTVNKDVSSAANKLLSLLLHQLSVSKTSNSRNLTTILLEDVVRPCFARSRSKDITAAGRKAIDPLPQALAASEDEQFLKPWKYTQRYVICVLRWVLEHSSAKQIEESWHLIMPPVLTLIDDEASDSKINGCNLLQILLEKVSSTMWSRTGLGKVFEDALNPVLAYLPPLIEQEEAERLINYIYPTLLSLCHHQFSAPEQRVKRLATLDNLMRAGILSGLSHSGENVKMSVLLLDQMCVILAQMEIYCVKHMKSIVPVLVGYLCDPFAFASTSLLYSVLTTLRCLIVNAWPRMDRYSGELFKGIATCWQRLSEEPFSEPISNIQRELRITLQLLMKALGESSTAKELEIILKNDEELSRLLP